MHLICSVLACASWFSIGSPALEAHPSIAAQQPATQQPATQQPATTPADEVDGSSASTAPVDERSRELNRILHVAGGGTVRSKTRWSAGQWEYRSQGAWVALPESAVTRVQLERDVLADAKSLRRKSEASGSLGRVQLADWMLHAGLVEEGLTELDRVLELEPDHVEALKLAQSPPVPIRIAGADAGEPIEAILAAAALPRALQEAAVTALGRREAKEAVAAALTQSLAANSPRVRAFAALATRRISPGANLQPLLSRAVLDGSDAVRREATLALRDAREPAVLVPIARAMGSSSAVVRGNAVDALGHLAMPAAMPVLISRLSALQSSGGGWTPPASHIYIGRQVAYIQDYDVEVAQFAAVGDPQVNVLVEGAVLDVRVVGVQEVSPAGESRRVRNALRRISGANPGDSNRAWMAWWDQNRSRYEGESTERTAAH